MKKELFHKIKKCSLMDSCINIVSISPTWPLNEHSTNQRKLKKLAQLCGVPSSDLVKNSLLHKNGLYIHLPTSKDQNGSHQFQQRRRTKKRSPAKPKSLSTTQHCDEKEISPGYFYKRTTDNVNVTLTEDFWKAPLNGSTIIQPVSEACSNELFNELKAEVDNLKVVIAEERFTSKKNMKKKDDDQSKEIQQVHQGYQQQIRSMEDGHQHKLQNTKSQHQEEVNQLTSDFQLQRDKLKNELTFLKENFESQQIQLNEQMERKWKMTESKIKVEMEEKVQKALDHQRAAMLKEKNFALEQLTTNNNKHLTKVIEKHQQEVEKLLQKFASSVVDAEKLKSTELKLLTVTEERDELKTTATETAIRLRKTENELADVKVKLATYENNFTEKVAEVEDRYFSKIDDLTKENLELRRKYFRKCEEVHELSVKHDSKQADATVEIKDLMQSVIKSVTRANVSLTAARVSTDDKTLADVGQATMNGNHTRKKSAPVTRLERTVAVVDSSGSSLSTGEYAHNAETSRKSFTSQSLMKLPSLIPPRKVIRPTSCGLQSGIR